MNAGVIRMRVVTNHFLYSSRPSKQRVEGVHCAFAPPDPENSCEGPRGSPPPPVTPTAPSFTNQHELNKSSMFTCIISYDPCLLSNSFNAYIRLNCPPAVSVPLDPFGENRGTNGENGGQAFPIPSKGHQSQRTDAPKPHVSTSFQKKSNQGHKGPRRPYRHVYRSLVYNPRL